jgi:uncharacterized damage-inducible protein DinB
MTDSRTLSPKARFAKDFAKESATTLKVLRAYPIDQHSLKPHDRSSSAMTLAWTFVVEQTMLLRALKNEKMFDEKGLGTPPETWDATVDLFEKGLENCLGVLDSSTNEQLDGDVMFFTGPKQMGEVPLHEFVWFMLYDQIHHRGQLSVYLRLAGGKVPSIYGPSADEPWR